MGKYRPEIDLEIATADVGNHGLRLFAQPRGQRLRRAFVAIELNKPTMDKYRDQMKKFYYDPAKYKTYLEQLGIAYPTVKKQ